MHSAGSEALDVGDTASIASIKSVASFAPASTASSASLVRCFESLLDVSGVVSSPGS